MAVNVARGGRAIDTWQSPLSRRRWPVWVDVGVIVGAVAAFIAVSGWWLSEDVQVQASDDGLHTLLAFGIHAQLAAGNLTGWFTEFNTYPPLAHLVGALAVFVGGEHKDVAIMAANVVFVPIMAASSYGIGRLAYGRMAGILAALFSLCAPIFVSQMHMFMVDPAEAAMVAATIWALLACRNFERPGLSALAGGLFGLAMMTKSTSVIFVLGVLLVMVARGGWRNWHGWLTFVLVGGAISLPWYVYHLRELEFLVEGQGGVGAAPTSQAAPALFSRASLLWYLWAAVNFEWYLPLSLFLLGGVVSAAFHLWQQRSRAGAEAELLAALAISWIGLTMIRHKDVRFMLPALVLAAVLATGWLTRLPRRGRLVAMAALSLVLVVDFVGTATGLGSQVRVALPGASGESTVYARQLTLYSPDGYVRGGPVRESNLVALMRAMRRYGIENVTFDAGSTLANQLDFSTFGLEVDALEAGLPYATAYDPAALGPKQAFMLLHVPEVGDPPPCEWLSGDRGVYVELGDAFKPFAEYSFYCPWRKPAIYRRTSPLTLAQQIEVHPELSEPTRQRVLALLMGMHAHGVKMMTIERAGADREFFQPTGVERLAAMAEIPVPAGLEPTQLSAADAYLVRLRRPRAGVAPCLTFPDGSVLYAIRGTPEAKHPDYVCYR